jgi:hypothetical protein
LTNLARQPDKLEHVRERKPRIRSPRSFTPHRDRNPGALPGGGVQVSAWRYDTHDGLVDAGYLYRGADRCFACGVRVFVYKTPQERLMPFDEIGGKLLPHFASCPKRIRRARVLEFPSQREFRLEE